MEHFDRENRKWALRNSWDQLDPTHTDSLLAQLYNAAHAFFSYKDGLQDNGVYEKLEYLFAMFKTYHRTTQVFASYELHDNIANQMRLMIGDLVQDYVERADDTRILTSSTAKNGDDAALELLLNLMCRRIEG
jgi:hypothetical protein